MTVNSTPRAEALSQMSTAWLSAAPKPHTYEAIEQPNRVEIYSRENVATLRPRPGLYSQLGEGTA